MSRSRCPFCIAKDDEIGRLHALVEKLAVAPMRMIPQPSDEPPVTGPSRMRSLAEEATPDSPGEDAIPMDRMVDAFNRIHGDDAWIDLAGIGKQHEDTYGGE